MAEDFTSKVLSEIRSDIAELGARMDNGLGRLETAQAAQADMVRGIASIMAGVLGRLEGIEARLVRLEQVKA